MKQCKTTWTIQGYEADISIAEFRATEEGSLASYEETKAIALERLQTHIRPYLARIKELESDLFRQYGALPQLKAWEHQYGQKAIVTAKTKKRAAEIMCESKYGLTTYWDECDGHWWYKLARQEAVWVPELDVDDVPTGEYRRCLNVDEATAILRQYVCPYRTLDPQELLTFVEGHHSHKATTDDGVAYEITTAGWRGYLDPSKLSVRFSISDGSGAIWLPPIILEAEFPKDVVAWKNEGF